MNGSRQRKRTFKKMFVELESLSRQFDSEDEKKMLKNRRKFNAEKLNRFLISTSNLALRR